MSAKPLIRENSETAPPGDAAVDRLAQVGSLMSEKIAEIEKLVAASPPSSPIAQAVTELRGLAARQASAHSSLAGELEAIVAQRTRELASLSHFLQTHGEREKAALARELHDALGGILTPAKMDLAWLENRLGKDPDFRDRMARLSAMIDQGIDLKRRIIENLRPSLLDHLGLASALQWYVEEQCRSSELDCRLHISDKLERLSPDMEITLYRVVQEGVTNAVKHAHAKRLDVTLERTPTGVRLEVADNGQGIADVGQAKGVSHGLAGMIHRVRSVGGTLDLESAPGKGTCIRVFVPLAR